MISQDPSGRSDSTPSLSDRFWRLPWLVRIGLVIVVGLVVVALFGNLRQAGSSSPDRTPAAGPSATPRASLPDGQIGPGVYLVGTDVEPGTYRTAGAVPRQYSDGYCFWSRHSSAAGGRMDDIIASDGSGPGAQLIVTIAAGDVLFRTDGCAPWEPVT